MLWFCATQNISELRIIKAFGDLPPAYIFVHNQIVSFSWKSLFFSEENPKLLLLLLKHTYECFVKAAATAMAIPNRVHIRSSDVCLSRRRQPSWLLSLINTLRNKCVIDFVCICIYTFEHLDAAILSFFYRWSDDTHTLCARNILSFAYKLHTFIHFRKFVYDFYMDLIFGVNKIWYFHRE